MASSASSGSPLASITVNVANFVSAKLRRDKHSNNYNSWREQILCLIESQDLLGFIDGKISPPPAEKATANGDQDYFVWRRTDRLVKGWILGALSDEVVEIVFIFDTARDVWLVLEKEFEFRALPPPIPAAEQGRDWYKYLPLYRAALRGDWDTAKKILDQDPDAANARVAFSLQTALHVAVGTGKAIRFVANLVDKMDDDSLAFKDDCGNNALHFAARAGNTAAARILVRRLPSLLYMANNIGYFPAHRAAASAHRDVLEFLISQTKDDMDPNPYTGDKDIALRLVDKNPDLARMKLPSDDSALKRMCVNKESVFPSGVRYNFWERLVYSGFQLDMTSEIQHTAPNSSDIEDQTCSIRARSGKVSKVAETGPEFSLHSLQCLQTNRYMESLSYTEASSIYIDAIIRAARLGIHEVVEVIVETFPEAIYSGADNTKHYIFQLAIQNRSEKVFNLIYQMNDNRHQFSFSEDSFGNNLLHLAACLAPPQKLNMVSGAALQMQREIQWYKEVEKFVDPFGREMTNHAGKTPAMIFTEEHKNLKIEGEKWMKDTANSCTIAAALIATVVFAAAIIVPGGNESDSGYPMFSTSGAFIIFAISDAISLFTSTTSLLMFLSILTSRYAEEDFLYALPKSLCIGLITLFVSISFMIVAFSAIVYLVFGRNHAWVLIPVAGLACLPVTSFVLQQFPLLADVISSTYGRGIFGKQSDRAFY